MTLEQIPDLLSNYQYWLLFPIVVFEGPIISVIAGFLIALGKLNFFFAYSVIIVADLVGDAIYYVLGRYGRDRFVKKYGRYVGITAERVDKLDDQFQNRTGRTLLLGKLAHGVGGLFLFTAGVTKVRFDKFIFYNLVGTIPKSLLLILIGYYWGSSYQQIQKYFDYTAWATVIIAIAVTISLFIIQKLASKNTGEK